MQFKQKQTIRSVENGFLDKLFDKSSDQQQVGKDFYEAIKTDVLFMQLIKM